MMETTQPTRPNIFTLWLKVLQRNKTNRLSISLSIYLVLAKKFIWVFPQHRRENMNTVLASPMHTEKDIYEGRLAPQPATCKLGPRKASSGSSPRVGEPGEQWC